MRNTIMRNPIITRSAILIVALGGLFALIARGYSAGFIGICADDFTKVYVAARGLAAPSEWFDNVWLPLHFVLIAFAGVLTNDMLFGARLISIAFGILLVAAMCGIGHQFGGNKGAAIAAILGATHPMVVLFSSSTMVDICYVATYMLGLRFYLKASQSEHRNPVVYLMACTLLTLACAFHYNAWIAVLLLIPFLCRDLYQAHLSRRVVLAGFLVLGSVPLAWVIWNWARVGDPIVFFAKHSAYSKTLWDSLGWHASTPAALELLKDSILVYSPFVAFLAFIAIGATLSRRSTAASLLVPWWILVGFLGAIVYLFANGGRPTAFEPRYILLPSALMITIASVCLARMCSAGNRESRGLVLMLSIVAMCVNIRLYDQAVEFTNRQEHYAYTVEARAIASVMKGPLNARKPARMMIEVKLWSYLVMPVFLNRVDALVIDRELDSNPAKRFDRPSLLLGEKEKVLARLQVKNVQFVAVYSPAIRSHIEAFGFKPFATIDSYAVYRVPRDASQLALSHVKRDEPTRSR